MPIIPKWEIHGIVGRLIASVTKKVRNISQIVRHTGSIGGWPQVNPSTV
ncbi:hypothetical protein ACBR37_16195 [Streptomyces sp. AD55]